MTKTEIEIIRALADSNMNVCKTAKKVYMHRNTVEYHLQRVKTETGLDPHNFYDLAELLKTAQERRTTTEDIIKALREKPSRDNRKLLDEAADRLEELSATNCVACQATSVEP